jgi:hypothetical protein
MSRDVLKTFVEEIENQIASDLASDFAAEFRSNEDIADLIASDLGDGPIAHEFRSSEDIEDLIAIDLGSGPIADAFRSINLPLLALEPLLNRHWFVEGAKRYLSGGVESLDRAFGLLRGRGKPFDPATSENLDLADEAFRLRYERGLRWKDVESQLDMDERTIRKMIESHFLAICRRRADAIVKRLPKIPPIERIKPALNSTE